MKFIEAYEDRATWYSFRNSLYHDLSQEFDNQEMELIAMDSMRDSYLIVNDKNDKIGLLEMSLRNFVDGCLNSPVAYIEGIYLTEEQRGKGYGRKIINWAKEWGRSRGCKELASDVELDNIEAQNFHQQVGFEETCRVVQYKMEISSDYHRQLFK